MTVRAGEYVRDAGRLVDDLDDSGRSVDAEHCPVRIVVVAVPVPVTAGTPYSRQTIAAWLIMPPMSVTVAPILPKTGPSSAP